MNYYIDTEFLEGKQDKRILGFKYGETKPTIDLISIGIVSSYNDNTYYAISKDFNLYEAWNRFEVKEGVAIDCYGETHTTKIYWIRENILKPIFYDLINKDINFHDYDNLFTYTYFKQLINKYGKTNKQIAEEVERFIRRYNHVNCNTNRLEDDINKEDTKFYGYYSAYDFVVLCQLFGKMINLPKGFPNYMIDLKQELDRKLETTTKEFLLDSKVQNKSWKDLKINDKMIIIKILPQLNYPKQNDIHHALKDAKWNKQLHEFIKTI